MCATVYIILARGFALDIPGWVATITAGTAVPLRWSWVVGESKAHGQQKALTVVTTAKREQDSRYLVLRKTASSLPDGNWQALPQLLRSLETTSPCTSVKRKCRP